MFAKTILATWLLAFFRTAFASTGNATVQNQCGFPVYLWSVSNAAPANPTIIQAGGLHTEEYYTNPNGGGISIKIGTANPAPLVTQFEYTLDSADNALWYDISNINGYPFEQWGLTLVPSDPNCASVTCDAGVAKCTDVYNKSDDDSATHECSSSADMVMVLCSGGAAAASSVASSAIVAATSAAPPSTFSAIVAATSAAPQSTSTPAPVIKSTTTEEKAESTPAPSVTSAKTTTTSTTPAVVLATPATSSDSDVVLTTTLVTKVVTVGGSSVTSVPTSTEDATTTTSTEVDVVFHGHTFHWPQFTGFPGAKVRRGHQHFHAHAHGAHHA